MGAELAVCLVVIAVVCYFIYRENREDSTTRDQPRSAKRGVGPKGRAPRGPLSAHMDAGLLLMGEPRTDEQLAMVILGLTMDR